MVKSKGETPKRHSQYVPQTMLHFALVKLWIFHHVNRYDIYTHSLQCYFTGYRNIAGASKLIMISMA